MTSNGPSDVDGHGDADTEEFERLRRDPRAYDDELAEPPPGGVSSFGGPPRIPPEDLSGLFEDASGEPHRPPRRVLPLDEEPSALVSRYLFPTEKFRGEWRKHWIHLFNVFLIGALATFLLGWFTGFLAKRGQSGAVGVAIIVWILVLFWVGWRVADWYYDRFVLTNKRIMAVSGLVTRNVAMMPLLRVTDMKYEQSSLGRILRYGTFVLESAGQDQALRTVKPLPNPNELYLRIVEEMYEPEAVEARLSRQAEEPTDGS